VYAYMYQNCITTSKKNKTLWKFKFNLNLTGNEEKKMNLTYWEPENEIKRKNNNIAKSLTLEVDRKKMPSTEMQVAIFGQHLFSSN